MATRERIIGGPTGGIRRDLLVPGTEGYFRGASNHRLFFDITDKRIHIEGLDVHQLFEAHVVRNNLRFNIYNRGSNGEKHPDLYARELARFAIPYFEEQERVEGISALWLRTSRSYLSVNYLQYRTHLRDLGKQKIDIEEKRDAAKKTWTGSLAVELGFSEVKKLRDLWNVRVLFKRPQ
jgi:hypothetical protein